MKPLVSVIVPNYNHANYLSKRLESIKSQTFKDFELILLDDASSDESLEILKNFANTNANTRFESNLQNSGSPFVQWNKGVTLAKGDFIWIAESDDFAHPKLLETLVSLLQSNTKVGIAYVQSVLVDEKDKTLNSYLENLEFLYKSKAWENDFIKNGKEVCREWLLPHNPIPNASGVLMRKEAYTKAGGANTQMRLNGDWHLYTKILLDWDLAFSAKELNYFRVHTQTQRSSSRKKASVYTELLTINTLIRKNVPSAESEANKALLKIGDWWIGNLPYHAWNKDNIKINQRLYSVFKKHKSNLAYRILLTFVISYLRDFLKFIGLLKPLKNLRSWLFPGKYWNK